MRWRLGIAMLFASIQLGCGRLGFDAGAGDAGTNLDPDADVTFCASRSPVPTFCDDFDSVPLSARWSNIYIEAPGVVAIENSDDAPSGTSNLLVEMEATSGSCRYNSVQARFPGAYSHAHLELELFVPAGALSDVVFAALVFNGAGSSCQALASDGMFAEQTIDPVDNRQYDQTPTGMFTRAAWHTIVIDHVITPGQEHLTYTVDGVSLVEQTSTFACLFASGELHLDVGVFCRDDPADQYALRFDNVVLDLE